MGTPVSGPGRFSERTDKAVGEANRQLPNADYGEQAAYQEQLAGAPAAQSPSSPSFSDMFGSPASRVIGFDADSQRPDVPVTDGAALGAGAGTEVLAQPPNEDTNKMLVYLPALEFMANRGQSDAARNLIRQIKGSM